MIPKVPVLLIGSGGREHAMADALSRSKQIGALYALPGNAGIHELAQPITASLSDHDSVIAACKQHQIGLVVIGPEAPLVDGLSDRLRDAGIPVFGCSQAAAQLEGSKAFTKELCRANNIPTAAYGTFHTAPEALAFLKTQSLPIVVKADGLAAGKGVVIATTLAEAEDAVNACFSGQFGAAGNTVVIEEFLEGEEVSYFIVTDGETVLALGGVQDHKRVGDGDTGPNTGGMGTYTPTPVFTPAIEQKVLETIITPSIEGLKKQGIRYQGVLFAGLMLTPKGPSLLEYNTRFGDPETQALLPLIESDFYELCYRTATGTLSEYTLKKSGRASLCVVMAAQGYPGNYVKNTEIRNLDNASALSGVRIYHAGTTRTDGTLLATGGRVLGICATADSIETAREIAYNAARTIDWPEGFYRNDIAWRAMKT